MGNKDKIARAIALKSVSQLTQSMTSIIKSNSAINNQPNKRASGKIINAFDNLNGITVNSKGSIVLDSTNFTSGSTSLKITSNTMNDTTDLYINRVYNLSDMISLELDMFVDVTKCPTQILMSMFTDTGHRFLATVPISGLINGWNTIKVPKTAFTIYEGNPTWNSITLMLFKFQSPASYMMECTIDTIIKNNIGRSGIVFTIDDIKKSAYTKGYPILKSRGLKGSLGVITDRIGDGASMSLNQLKEMYNDGWDVLNHSKTHSDPASLSYEAIVEDIVSGRDCLVSNGFTRGSDIYIYPIQQTALAERVAKDCGIRFARGTRQRITYEPVDDPWNVGSVTLTNKTINDVISQLENVKICGGILVFLIHDITTSGTGALEVAEKTISDIADYCLANNINVMTLTELYETMYI